MDFVQILSQYISYITVVACYCVGLIIKKWIADVDNKYIPTIVGVIGIVFNVWATASFTPEVVLTGLVSGLASCGTFELFRNLFGKNEKMKEED